MKSNITVGLWCRDKQTKEIYSVVKVGENIKIDHSVEDESWVIPEEIFREEFSIVRGLKAQRAEILNDVILQLNQKRYKSVSGEYARLKTKNGDTLDLCDYFYDDSELCNVQISEYAKENIKSCSVCAIGSVFMSAVDIHNKLKFGQLDGGDYGLVEYLGTWFSDDEMRLMEWVFEGCDHGYNGYLDDIEKAVLDFRDAVSKKTKLRMGDKNFQETVLREIIANTLKFDTFLPQKGLVRETLDTMKKVG